MTPKRGPNPETELTNSIRGVLDMMHVPHFKHWSGPFSEKGVPDLIGTLPGRQSSGAPMTREKAREMAADLTESNGGRLTDVQALVILAIEVERLRARARPFWCEVKMPGKSLAEDQMKFLGRMRAAGAPAFVAYSARDVISELAQIDFQPAIEIERQFTRRPEEPD